MKAILALTAALALLGSGCLSDPAQVSEQPDNDTSVDASRTPTARVPKPSPPPAPEVLDPGWPPIETATIRPGVQVTANGGQCTSNFIFRDATNKTLYVGVAAHCFGGMKYGDPVTIQGASEPGVLAYSSWIAQNESLDNDFALVAVDPKDRNAVHPAVLHFGGPVRLIDSKTLVPGDRLLTYGHSSLRLGVDPSNWHEGLVTRSQQGPTFFLYTLTPGVPGDSGSGVLTKDGGAAGILVTLALAPYAGENGASGLALQLKLAQEKGGLNVTLCTWGLLDDGILP